MNNLAQAIWVETLKARRSKMPLLTALGFMLVPFVGGFFMLILKDPELARRIGVISAKAQLTAGSADWPSFLDLMTQAIVIGGIVLFGFIGSWVFGREYADHTLKDLLALPTSRSTIVLSKFVVVMVWSLILATAACLIGLGVGAAVGLPPVPAETIWQGSLTLAIAALLTTVLVTPIAFVASAGHGYLPPLGATVLAIFLAQIIAVLGWGEYFPWSIPALYSQGSRLAPVSYLIVLLAAGAGIVATFVWWERADQTH
jgi:ABC-2 type transport system permease protein